MMPSMPTRYSVIVATYNRADLLNNCLTALARQSVPHNEYEILLINDGSKDHTDLVVNEFKEKYPEINLIYFKQNNRGVSHARNVGIKNARGEILFFTDDDCVAPHKWIETLASAYDRHPDIAGAGGWYEYPNYNREGWGAKAYLDYTRLTFNYFCFFRSSKKQFEIKNNIFDQNPAGNTSNMSYRKKTIEEIGGFDETMYFVGLVDFELKKRIMDRGYPLLFIQYPVLHFKPLGFKELVRKSFNRGRGRHHIIQKNPELELMLRPSLTKAFRRMAARGENRYRVKCMAVFDYCLMMVGREYQKLYEMILYPQDGKPTSVLARWVAWCLNDAL